MQDADASLMTLIGSAEGEILTRLEGRRPSTLRGLIRQLPWPAHLTTMAVGGLIRAGLIRARQQGGEVLVEPATARAAGSALPNSSS